MYRITIEEINGDAPAIKRYEQTVDAIDLPLVQEAVNTKPRPPRKSRAKSAPAAQREQTKT